jgi:hypothetical protein
MDTILYALQVDKLYFHGLSPLYHNLNTIYFKLKHSHDQDLGTIYFKTFS